MYFKDLCVKEGPIKGLHIGLITEKILTDRVDKSVINLLFQLFSFVQTVY